MQNKKTWEEMKSWEGRMKGQTEKGETMKKGAAKKNKRKQDGEGERKEKRESRGKK